MNRSRNNETSEEDSSAEPEQYEVEKILNKRTRRGKTEYLIKWLNYSPSNNSWEPEENLNDSLIESLEKAEGNVSETNAQQNEPADPQPAPSTTDNDDEQSETGESTAMSQSDADESNADESDTDNSGAYRYKFEGGAIPVKILAAKKEDGEVLFLFEYENSDEGEFIPARVANIKYPQLVIEFYQGITFWTD